MLEGDNISHLHARILKFSFETEPLKQSEPPLTLAFYYIFPLGFKISQFLGWIKNWEILNSGGNIFCELSCVGLWHGTCTVFRGEGCKKVIDNLLNLHCVFQAALNIDSQNALHSFHKWASTCGLEGRWWYKFLVVWMPTSHLALGSWSDGQERQEAKSIRGKSGRGDAMHITRGF